MATTVAIGGETNTLGRIFIGEDKTLAFEMLDGDPNESTSAPVDVTGYGFTFLVRKSLSSTALLTKTATITGTYNATRASNTQRATVTLADTDLASSVFTPGTYLYSLKRTDDGSETITHAGPFILEQATQV